MNKISIRLLLSIVLSLVLTQYVHAAAVDCPTAYTDQNNHVHKRCVSTFPVTAGIRTGMIKLGSTDSVVPPNSATINWGDGHTSVALLDCSPNLLTTHCEYWGRQHIYAKHGPYSVVVTNNNGVSTQPMTLPVVDIGNFVIVSIGDSVASGEGNPIVPNGNGHTGYWDYDPCHGSTISGPAIAARTIINDNKPTRVTFIHLACSGAQINGDYWMPNNAYGQLFELRDILPIGTKIDALLITVGANNVHGGFSKVIDTCIGPYPSNPEYTTIKPDPNLDCSRIPEPTDEYYYAHDKIKTLHDDLNNIPNIDYSNIENFINKGYLNVSNANVYITNYFDPTHDSSGNFPTLDESKLCSGALMLPDEWEYLFNNMLVRLNSRVTNVSNQYGWHHVGGSDYPIAADFKDHGYCIGSTGESWIVNITQSVNTQGDTSGTGHPNSIGQQHIATRIVHAIYTWQLPVTIAAATTGGTPYSFGTWTHDDVMVSLSATNKLAQAGHDKTIFSIDDPNCSDANTGSCIDYSNPFPVTAPGSHTIYFLSDNKSGNFEKVKTSQIMIDKPESYDDSISTTTDQSVSGRLQANNPNSNDTLTYNVATLPNHGTVTLTDVNKGIFTYEPESGYIGNDSFTFMLNNGYVDSNIATESVTVAAAVTSGSQPTSSGSGGSGTVGPMFLVVLALLRILLIQQRRIM